VTASLTAQPPDNERSLLPLGLLPGEWTLRSPIALIDRYLLALRWALIAVAGGASVWGRFHEQASVAPWAVWLAVIAYNLPLSWYVWRVRPVAHGHAGWLVLADVLQGLMTTVLTGGYYSFFFLLFLQPITEAALAFAWRVAAMFVVGVDALFLAAGLFIANPFSGATTAYLLVGKFLTMLVVGSVVIALSELLRRENRARQEAQRAIRRLALLNQVFLDLSESALDAERTFDAVLEGVHALPHVVFSLILVPGEHDNGWRVAASTSPEHPVGEEVAAFAGEDPVGACFSVGEARSSPLPAFVGPASVEVLDGVYIFAPEGDLLGILVVGRRSSEPLSEEDRAFLRALAFEAGLALRNVRLYAQEREHVRRLQRFETLQSTFFSAVAHELKTPLSVLKMMVPALHRLPQLQPETQAEILETVEKNVQRLEGMVRDMLESARLEAGAVILHRRATRLRPLVDIVLETYAPLMARRGQRVVVQIDDDLPPLWVDATRIEQVLANLLANAAKFSPPGSTIVIEAWQANGEVQVCVADEGPGIPTEERERIFDRFYTAAKHSALVGVGLGLYICKEVVRLHGGRIWVEDRPGGGSRFCLTLPVVRGDGHGEGDAENPGY